MRWALVIVCVCAVGAVPLPSLVQDAATSLPTEVRTPPESAVVLGEMKTKSEDAKPAGGGVTVIVMNWNRPETLAKTILPSLNSMGVISEVLVSHGKQETMFDTPKLNKVRHLDHIKLSEQVGLLRRYVTAKEEATTDCVMHMDDDMMISESAIDQLYAFWKESPNVVHGYNGRSLFLNNNKILYSPTPVDVEVGEVSMILTQCAMTSRKVCIFALEQSVNFEGAQRDLKAQPYWNGEDVLLSLSSIAYNQKNNASADKVFPVMHPSTKKDFGSKFEKDKGLSTQWAGHKSFRGDFANVIMQHYHKAFNTDFSHVIKSGEPTVELPKTNPEDVNAKPGEEATGKTE